MRFLSVEFLAVTAVLANYFAAAGRNIERNCKIDQISPDWPSTRRWAALNESLEGRLLAPPPPGAVCHPDQPSYDSIKCSAVQTAWHTFSFHQDDPVSSFWNQYANSTCLPDQKAPCSGDGYPAYVVNASDAKHVKIGMEFARQNKIHLVIRSTGHDYMGRSSGPSSSLSIWTHHLKSIQLLDRFQPQGCQDIPNYGPAVRLGAGTQLGDVYTTLDRLNRTIVGGTARTVSIGGYLTGGGHSMLSSRYGLAADQVLEMELVTPGGDILVANECQNQDLFWAMRGGGGSTFGVMTSATVKTFPSPAMAAYEFNLTMPATASNTMVVDITTYLLAQSPYLVSQGISGYVYIYSPISFSKNGRIVNMTLIATTFAMQDTTDPTVISAAFAPLRRHIASAWPNASVEARTATFPSFDAWFGRKEDPQKPGVSEYLGSRLLDDAALAAGNATRLRDSVLQMVESGRVMLCLVSGKGVWDAVPVGGSNAVLPAWRRAVIHAISMAQFPPFDRTAEREALRIVDASLAGLRRLAPDSGAYINEANPFEPNFQQAFWGSNYDRLLRIKRDVDPEGVLWCHPCVGGMDWEWMEDGRLCRVGET